MVLFSPLSLLFLSSLSPLSLLFLSSFSPLSLLFSLGSLLFSQKEVSYGFEILHGLLSNKNIRIPTKKNWGPPITLGLWYIWGDKF
jgi:hypothetical protein